MSRQVHEGDVYTIVDASPGPENRPRDDVPGFRVDGLGRTAIQAAAVDLPVDR
jgi:hypothetical protein